MRSHPAQYTACAALLMLMTASCGGGGDDPLAMDTPRAASTSTTAPAYESAGASAPLVQSETPESFSGLSTHCPGNTCPTASPAAQEPPDAMAGRDAAFGPIGDESAQYQARAALYPEAGPDDASLATEGGAANGTL